ncbi:hypothetical protein BGW36DRAFT_422620 [Talaromyces proteolyticus]|uniref:Uncharacterized protein n=1 Tax=Talaromyces proteolyticus TaxID=1131652 RepID=A0AAD4Q4F5_9EURO|nr:uncharacterized protein BGW36DRAFT_422620 [Talaromyces proteolyticus]KAH8703039.1 hypothetical protein BGW36DRAFT_422620 [Talaromyces proteolyticus]
MAYRGCIWNCDDGLEQIGVASAPNFTGPYTRAHDYPIFPSDAEDPFVWRDKRGNFHLLMHSLDSADNGVGSGPKVALMDMRTFPTNISREINLAMTMIGVNMEEKRDRRAGRKCPCDPKHIINWGLGNASGNSLQCGHVDIPLPDST